MKHQGTATLETARLILRRFTMDDCEAAFRNWESDPRTTEFLTWKTMTTIDATRYVMQMWVDGYANPDFYQWAIVPKEIGEPVGTISVVGMNEKAQSVSIGYCIGSKWWRQGYTSEAFAAIIPFLFEQVEVNRIEAQHDPGNPNSGRVMQKCGLIYEGTLRQADWNNKGIADACVYAVLRSDYNKQKG